MSDVIGKICDQCDKINYSTKDFRFWVHIETVIGEMGEIPIIQFNNRTIEIDNNKDFCCKDCLIKWITGESHGN